MESISQRLREQYIKGLSGIEGGHSQNTFWPEIQSEETGKTLLNSPTKKEEDRSSSLEETWIGSEETLKDPGNINPSLTKGRSPDKNSVLSYVPEVIPKPSPDQGQNTTPKVSPAKTGGKQTSLGARKS